MPLERSAESLTAGSISNPARPIAGDGGACVGFGGCHAAAEGYQAIMGNIYSPKHYYQRVKTLLSEFGTPQARIPMDFQRILSFFRSSLRLGIMGKERIDYWRLLLWTLIRKPRQLPLAVTLAIYGHHFRRICELYIL